MQIVVRPLRDDETRLYVDIVNSAIRGLAVSHYPPEAIDAWIVPVSDESMRAVALNADEEIRVIAELAGLAVGIGSLVTRSCELRACYVLPAAARRGVGSAIVRHIEGLARETGLPHLELAASLNAEAFYSRLGYRVEERREVTLRNGYRLAAVWMRKSLA